MVATYLFMKNVWQTMFLHVDLEKLLSDVRATDLMWHDLAVYNFLGSISVIQNIVFQPIFGTI